MRTRDLSSSVAITLAGLALALVLVPHTAAAQTPPSYISHTCASDGGSVAIYWGSSSGAANYAIRADNTGTYCGGFSGGNNNVGCVSGADYVEDNNTSQFQFLYITVPGNLIHTWAHGVNGGSWSASTDEYFTCPVPAPTCSLSATSVDPGGYTTFYWSTSNASAFSIYPAPGSMWMSTPSSGSWSYGPIYSTQTFTGTASNNYGQAGYCYATATVNQPPVPGVGITASPSTITQGSSSQIEWASSNATSCTGSGFSTGGATSGTVYVSPSSSTSYSVSCSGAGGTTSRSVTVTVNAPPAPSCTITLASSTVAYGTGTTLSWTSSNTTSFYISNVGYVTPTASGSVAIQPSATTAYAASCSGAGGTVASSNGTQTLTVVPPARPTSNITSGGNPSATINVGDSITINASFTVPSNDTLTYANIDQPLGNGLAATTTPGSKSYVFTPSVAGTYNFLARAKTAYYTSWTTVGTTTVTVVEPPPTCSFSASPASVTQGQTVTIDWDCSSATSCTGTGFSTGGATAGSVAVTANSSTNYSISCTGVGGGTYNGVASDPVTVTCAPLYSCSGDDITYTDASCDVTTIDTCDVPAYCVAGQSACQFADIDFVEFDELPGGLTGHLQAQPAVIRTGDRTRLYWQITGAVSCAVSGGGQNWTGLTSGSAGVQTNALTQLTRYTLTCAAHEGHDDLEETFDVLITPRFNEH